MTEFLPRLSGQGLVHGLIGEWIVEDVHTAREGTVRLCADDRVVCAVAERVADERGSPEFLEGRLARKGHAGRLVRIEPGSVGFREEYVRRSVARGEGGGSDEDIRIRVPVQPPNGDGAPELGTRC